MKTCAFFGHRNVKSTEELKIRLEKILREMIEKEGYETFLFGGLGDFDELCYKLVTYLKKSYGNIKRVFYLYDPNHQVIDKRPLWLLSKEYEEILYPNLEHDWWYKRIYFRNLEMVKISDRVIFYVLSKENSGAYKTMQYAIKKGKAILNVAKQ